MTSMGLPIILDKSALQMLGPLELESLTRHYFLVLPPILITEIQGDLYKKTKSIGDETEINRKAVQVLANKISIHDACKNVSHQYLCIANLLGHDVFSAFRPAVQPTESGTNAEGKNIAIINNEIEMEMIHNWQHDKFDENVKEYARAWKELSTQTDLNEYKQQIPGTLMNLQATTLKEIVHELNEAFTKVTDSNFHWALISYYCKNLSVAPQHKHDIEMRWKHCLSKFIDFAPYAYYCFLVQQVFVFGLAKNLIPASKNAKAYVDLQYVYYFPYARIFSSNDNLHIRLWEAFGNSDQQLFIKGEDLKKDLGQLSTHWQNISEQERNELRRIAPHPPILDDSFTCNAYKKMVNMGVMEPREHFKGDQVRRRSREEEKALVERLIANSKIVHRD